MAELLSIINSKIHLDVVEYYESNGIYEQSGAKLLIIPNEIQDHYKILEYLKNKNGVFLHEKHEWRSGVYISVVPFNGQLIVAYPGLLYFKKHRDLFNVYEYKDILLI